ncbi:MAG: hypothetical protein ACI31S_04035 [Bacilli bacterium]
MNIYLIEEYVNRLKKSDIVFFALKQGIILDSTETDIIYDYIKKNYKTIIYGNPKDILLEIKSKVKPLTYNKIENLYIRFKDKIDNFTKDIRES